jgi:hypothetical protein
MPSALKIANDGDHYLYPRGNSALEPLPDKIISIIQATTDKPLATQFVSFDRAPFFCSVYKVTR